LCHPSWLVRRSKRLCGSGREGHYALLGTWLKCQRARDQGSLEGLPVRHRPVTRKVLEVAGFAGRDLWRYIHRRLDAPLSRGASPLAEVSPSVDPAGWQLTLREADRAVLGEAIIGRPIDGIGVLWWISIAPAARRRGLGRALLGQCFTHLAANGAREVIAYVDDDASPGDTERDRTSANRLYDQAGFAEVDRLHSFLRGR
jgi:ribosomal protein S18 acetylase RimI-like enzyme